MKLQVVVDGRTIEIDSGQLKNARQVEPGVYSVLVDGVSYEVRVQSSPPGLIASADGRQFAVEVRNPRDAGRSSHAAAGSGRQNVATPMPGKVVRVLVKPGEAVEASQGLVVVEAMKMQNELKAGRPGRVAEIRTSEGETVSAGDVLVVLE